MNINYIPQLGDASLSFVLPCWLSSPLTTLKTENKVMVIHTDPDLANDLSTSMIAELAVFGKERTALYSMKQSNILFVRRLMDFLSETDFTNDPDLLQRSKKLAKVADWIKMIEKAKLNIYDTIMPSDELLTDIKKHNEEADTPSYRQRIIIIDDLLSIQGIVKDGAIDKKAAKFFVNTLKQYAADYKNSYLLLSETPLHEIFPRKTIDYLYVTMQGKEHRIEALL